jgi:hypothetical protein
MFATRHRLRRATATAMLVAVFSFILQATLVTISQAEASMGSMPSPAVVLAGAVHYHDNLARHVHSHGGAMDHVHHSADTDDDANAGQVITLGLVFAATPTMSMGLVLSLKFTAVSVFLDKRLLDFKPDGLNRPPSTLDIA